jgi:hypothetical protein
LLLLWLLLLPRLDQHSNAEAIDVWSESECERVICEDGGCCGGGGYGNGGCFRFLSFDIVLFLTKECEKC